MWHTPTIIESILRAADCKTHQALRLTHRNFWIVSSGRVLADAKRLCNHRACANGTEWCQCDCVSMKQHRIQTAVRNWRCSVHSPCVETYDTAEHIKYRGRVCRKCFTSHWVKTATRPDSFCVKL